MWPLKTLAKILFFFTSLVSLPVNATLYTYTSYLESSGWVDTNNTIVGNPLSLESELNGNFYVPLIDPTTHSINSVTMRLTMFGGGDVTSLTQLPKVGGYELDISTNDPTLTSASSVLFTLLTQTGIQSGNQLGIWDTNVASLTGGGIISHTDTLLLSSSQPLNYYGIEGSNTKFSGLSTAQIDYSLLLNVGSEDGDFAYGYLDEAYIDIYYDLTDLAGIGPNFPTISGSGNSWNTQIQFAPVPLPGAFWLFSSALIGFVWNRKSCRRPA